MTRPRRVRTPVLLQMEAVECGAASLGIILSHYDRIVPLAQLREECSVSRDGTNAWNLLTIAQRYGLDAKGLKASIEQLQTLPPPYIVFWEFNHFLVVEGFSRRQVYLNDPAIGRRRVPLREFSESYTGIVLTMQPGNAFQPGGQKRNTIAALARRLRYSWGAILFCGLAGLLLTLTRLAVPLFAQVFVDEVLIQHRQGWLRPLLLGMGIALILRLLLAKLRLHHLRRLMLKLSAAFSAQFFRHALQLPITFYVQRYAGEISDRLPLNDRIADLLSGRFATTIIDAAMMVFYLLVMAQYDSGLTAIVLSFALVNLIALRLVSQRQIETGMRFAQEQGKVVGVAISGIQAIETVKASGREADLFTRFAGYHARASSVEQQLSLQTQGLATLPVLLNALAIAAVLVLGGQQVIAGRMTIGMLVAYQSLTQSFLEPINSLVNFGSTLQELEADLDRLDDVLQNAPDPEIDRPSPITAFAEPLRGRVELRHLTFGFSRAAEPLIRDFNLSIQSGQRVALVGASGSGKSTIARLLAGLYQLWEGEILLDGVPRCQIPRSHLAAGLAMVDQSIALFSGSIRDNLTLWNPAISDQMLDRACQDAVIGETIAALPAGYDTLLIEGGMNFSGGQRQRLEIARALVNHPAVLILDEATSALDPETERQIDDNLRRRGCTCLIVAHRLSTIRDCDEILVLDRGTVVERGTHEQLWQQNGVYVQLLQSV